MGIRNTTRNARAGLATGLGRIAIAGAALALVLGACGSSDSSDEDAATAAAPAAATTEDADTGGTSSYGSGSLTPAAGAADATTDAAPASDAAVSIDDFAFSPATATFSVGQTVTVTNNDSAPHTWTSAEGGFDTGRLAPGESTTVTLTKAGTFDVVCTIHPSMTGTVTVTG